MSPNGQDPLDKRLLIIRYRHIIVESPMNVKEIIVKEFEIPLQQGRQFNQGVLSEIDPD